MELIHITYPFDDLNIVDELVLTIGEFDGLHLGHLKIFNEVNKIKKNNNLKSAIMSFDSHPDLLLSKVKEITYLTPTKKKEELLEKLGFDYFIILEFNYELASTSHEIFASQLLKCLNVSHLVTGPDFRYGYRGLGNVETLSSDFNTKITVCSEYTYNNCKLGTMSLKEMLKDGNVEEVNKLLFTNYQIEGKVIEGNKIGRTYNFPTANILLNDNYYIPRIGVYEVNVFYNDYKYHGICNIGHNPTFNYQQNISIEVHLFNFNGDLYNKNLKIEFIRFIRPEVKFLNMIQFIEQLKSDVKAVNESFIEL